MKIGQFSDTFLPIVDGVGRVVYHYATSFARRGEECYVIAPMADTGYRGGYPFELVDFISMELPRTPQQMDKAIRGMVEGRYEWVVFTATRELIGIFRKLGLSLLELAPADPGRLPEPADDWGSYYDSEPIVVAGRVRLALEKAQAHA